MVIDLGELKRIVSETVIDRFDHADLNADALFRDRIPTTENIAIAVWELLAPKLGAGPAGASARLGGPDALRGL